MKNKKGVAPVVATVLLVALTIVLAAIIFLWVRGFVSEQILKFGQSAEQVCDEISFDAAITSGEAGGFILDLTNNGQIPINDFDIKKQLDGKSEIERITVGLDKGASQPVNIRFDSGLPTRITVIPVLLGTVKGGGAKSFKCADSLGKILDVPQSWE
ncbi:hypothetical protein HZA33_03385 [Candidatus Pacearchaeota archaeon]|nr:hypothetical protein [Candidatus Pacearchaeota archaeon]